MPLSKRQNRNENKKNPVYAFVLVQILPTLARNFLGMVHVNHKQNASINVKNSVRVTSLHCAVLININQSIFYPIYHSIEQKVISQQIMKQIKTFFDKDIFRDDLPVNCPPYGLAVNLFLWAHSEDEEYCDNVESHAFGQVLEHENWMYEPRGRMIGRIDIYENDRLVYPDENECFRIPSWVEGDYCRFGNFAAGSIIVTTDFSAFEIMKNACAHKLLNAILVLTSGVPRFVSRRFIYLLMHHTNLPVFFLVDNDTWGYFCYSVLQRGCLAPYKRYEFDAIADCHFLGLNVYQAEKCVSKGCPTRPWEQVWDERIKALSRYDCFSSPKWQDEFEKFKEHGYAVDLDQVLQYCGFEWIADEIEKQKKK
jgi:hypothetical protein